MGKKSCFYDKRLNIFLPRPPWRTSKLLNCTGEASSHHKITCTIHFLHFFVVNFSHLDPYRNPHSQCGSGFSLPKSTRIRIHSTALTLGKIKKNAYPSSHSLTNRKENGNNTQCIWRKNSENQKCMNIYSNLARAITTQYVYKNSFYNETQELHNILWLQG